MTWPGVETRHHTAAGVRSFALWSPCGDYRYALGRRWAEGPELLYVMLNPSRATEAENDPTIERCQRRASALGFGAFTACNLFAFCATDPRDLKAHPDPVGAATDAILSDRAARAQMVLCAWGVHGTHGNRHLAVAELLSAYPLQALGLTRDGHPRHPLYMPYAARPRPWTAPIAAPPVTDAG